VAVTGLTSLVQRFSGRRALVVGDVMLDAYYEGTASRLCPEAPVPVIQGRARLCQPGGAGNTAVNARALGATVALLGVVGADATGDLLQACLQAHQVPTQHLLVAADRPTTIKLRLVADGHLVARYDEGITTDLSPELEATLHARFRTLYAQCDVVIISDYLKGAITPRFLRLLTRLLRKLPRPVVVDCKDLARHPFRHVTVLTPNHHEARLAGRSLRLSGEVPLERLGQILLARLNVQAVVITLGAEGALLIEPGQPARHLPVRTVAQTPAIGAGDALAATLGLALAAGADLVTATRLAVDAASLAVRQPRTAIVSREALLAHLAHPVPDGVAVATGDGQRGRRP